MKIIHKIFLLISRNAQCALNLNVHILSLSLAFFFIFSLSHTLFRDVHSFTKMNAFPSLQNKMKCIRDIYPPYMQIAETHTNRKIRAS